MIIQSRYLEDRFRIRALYCSFYMMGIYRQSALALCLATCGKAIYTLIEREFDIAICAARSAAQMSQNNKNYRAIFIILRVCRIDVN